MYYALKIWYKQEAKNSTFHNLFELQNFLLREPDRIHATYVMKFKYSSGTPAPNIIGMHVCTYYRLCYIVSGYSQLSCLGIHPRREGKYYIELHSTATGMIQNGGITPGKEENEPT